jgi:hypothetical protein
VHPARAVRTHLPAEQFARGVCGGDLDRLHALAGEDRVEDASEFGVAVPDDKAERRDPVAEVHEQVAGLLSSPCAVWVGGQAQDVHMAGLDLHDEQHVQASEEDGAGVEEVAGQ